MNQKQDAQEDLLALTDETFDRMEGDPQVIETMRALCKLSIELKSEALQVDAPSILH